MSTQSHVIYKVKQLGFDAHIINEVEKYFLNELSEEKKKEVEPLISFIESILDVSTYSC